MPCTWKMTEKGRLSPSAAFAHDTAAARLLGNGTRPQSLASRPAASRTVVTYSSREGPRAHAPCALHAVSVPKTRMAVPRGQEGLTSLGHRDWRGGSRQLQQFDV